MPKRKQGEVDNQGVQDFELIELLIREAGSNAGASSTSQGSDFESFEARFQSYIDQIPSYLHSVGKEGFFPHFFLGSFSTLIDTEIAKKLDIEKIYFSFDGSKTLKVAVIKKGGITSPDDAANKVKLFVIGESDSIRKKFSYGELDKILGNANIVQNNHVRQARDKGMLGVKLVEITKKKDAKGKTAGISVEVKSDNLDQDTSTAHEFKEIKKGIWNNPESDIAELTNSDKKEVKKSLNKVLKKIGEVHSGYRGEFKEERLFIRDGSLTYAKEAREAAHHGFVAGALVNFRYRHNLRVYLEQFAGRGYADIVLVPRGKDRSLNAIPIIMEMKAATKAELKEGRIGEKSGTTPTAALKQAEDYTKGFQPNVMRVLTTANDILCVGVNLDHPSPVSDIMDKSRNQKITPLFDEILISIDGRNNGRINEEGLKEKVQNNVERIYHTFPGTGEKGDNHYFSRFLLGQSLLLNEVQALESNFEKHIFIYGENIPTETRSEGKERDVPQREAAKKGGEKLAESTKLDQSHGVTTMVFIPENDKKSVYVMNIVETDGRTEVLKKGIPLDQLKQKVGNRKIVELDLNFNMNEKSNFQKYFSIEVKEPVSLEQYNNKKTDKFKGSFENVPYPSKLKEAFDEVLKSQHVPDQSASEVSDPEKLKETLNKALDKYKELLGKVGEGVSPFKSLIEKEAHFQAVLHGLFSHYSDIKLGESPESRALILTEFQTGKGKRVDMLVHGVKFADRGSNAKEYIPIGLELKGPREGKEADALKKEANKQITDEYKEGVTYKTLTDGDKVACVGVVFDKKAGNANSLIQLSNEKEFTPVKVVHSSIMQIGQQPPKKKFNPNSCVKPGGRSKRSVNPCLFSKVDVEKFSKGRVDEDNVDKIIIDSEKFLTYVKNSQDEAKNAQLVEFIGDKNIEGDRKYLLDKVVGDQGYERYVQNERIKDLQGDIVHQDSSLTKNPKLKSRLMNAAGGIQLIRGIHGAIVSCQDGVTTDCGLNLGGIGWSFASQPIENAMVKITPKVLASAEKVVGKIRGVLGKQTKFAVQVAGVKFGSKIAKGAAGAITGVFDIVDIGISASNLVDCKKRENSDNPCGEKEIRDNIASISFSTISFVSGIALTALGMPGVGIAAGVALMVASGVYSGVSNIVEYEKKYDTTHDENWRIFWHTFAFQPIPEDVQHLAARKEMVNSLTKGAWKRLNDSPDNVVAYAFGLGRVSGNTLSSSSARILMNKKDTAYTKNLSRVIPDSIEGASMICLPQITNQDYEKGITSSVASAVYYCENAVVISRSNTNQANPTIIYDLQNVVDGRIIGSNEWNNNFLIDKGNIEITGSNNVVTGGDNVVNKFVFLDTPSSSGKVIGGRNSTNILDLSEAKKDRNINVAIQDNIVSGNLKVRINGRVLVNSVNPSNYYYVGRKGKMDEILCMDHSTPSTRHEVIVDSGGSSNNDEKDVVENCKKVIISPCTTVKGGKSNYTFYVKTGGYKGRDLRSEIVGGTGTIVFSEFDLLSDCDQITYSTDSNTLSLKINFGQDNQITLDIKNYVEQSSNKPHFVLIDKNGSNIVPKIERSDSATIKITSFELHSEHSLGNFKNVENHYKKILNNNKDYKVLSVIRGKTQNQNDSRIPHMVFGSSGDDVINFDQGTMFARGGKGSDVYVITDDINNKEVKIDNYSDDEKADTLFMPEVEKDFLVQECNLHLNYNNTSIQVKNYLQDRNYRHLVIMNKKGEAFIPDIQSMSCSSSGKGKLVPFLQATQTQNMFLLPKDFQGDHVVIDSHLQDIKKYKDKDDLLLMRESEIPFIIRIEEFYIDRSKWESISYSLWNNNDLLPSPELLENVDNVMEYKDKLRNDYERIVKEYIMDFSNPTTVIQHNQKSEKSISTFIEEERIGVMILKNTSPDQVEVLSSGKDLIFHDKKSNHTIKIKDWDNNESYRISKLEFDLGLEPIKILRLNRFSLSEVREIQNLIDKASENHQNREEYTSKVENDFRCLTSIHSFMKKPAYQCSGFFSLQDQTDFVKSACSQEQVEEFENNIPSARQFMMLLEKLHNDLSLNGYNQNTIDKCSQVITSGFGVLNLWINKAVDEDKWDEVQTLLDRTANRSNTDVEHKNKSSKSWTLLNYFVYNGNVDLGKDIFKLILKKSGSIDALEDVNGWAALHYAVHYVDINMTSFLVDEGAKVDVKNKEGKTPLYLVIEEAKKNKLNMIQLLVERGADIEAKDNDGKSPLYFITYSGDLDTIKLLFEMIKAKDNSSLKTIKEIDSLRRKTINQQNIPSTVKNFVDSYVSDAVQTVAEELRDNVSMHGCATIVNFGDEIYEFNKELFKEIITKFISVVYSKTLDSNGILECIDSYHHAEEKIYSYIALLDEMKRNDHLSDNAAFKLAYNVKEIIGSGEKYDLREIKNRLPGCVNDVVFPSKVCIKNVNFGEYLYPTDTKVTDNRRVIATNSIDKTPWKVEFKDGKFYIISNEGEYLYAANYGQYDDERRSVFTWIGGSQAKNDEWNIVPKGDICNLVNVGQREYLYSPVDGFKGKYHGWTIFSPRTTWRPVFTWIGGDQVTHSEWKFEDCSRSRRKRDVEEFESEVSLGSRFYKVTGARENFDDTKILELSARLQNNLLPNPDSDESIVHWYSRPGNQEMLNKMMFSVLASVKEAIYPDQLNSRLDLDSCSKSNASSCPPLMRNIYNTINLDKKNIFAGKENVLEITSGYERLDIENFPIQEKVINVNRKRSLLDLSKLVKQVDRNLGIKPIPMIVKEKNDLLIKLSISATGLKKDVMTVRIKDALMNNSYKNLQIVFDNVPMEIDNNLKLTPSILISNNKITVVTPENIEEGNKLIICREVEGYTFLHHKYDLIMTDALSANVSEKELYVMYFKDFYKEPKMKTLSIRFIDKEILLDDKINKIYNSDSIDKLNHANFTVDLQDRGINIKANDFHDDTVLKLAYCIKEVIEKTNNKEEISSFERLKNKLPESVKNIVFSPIACIKNIKSNGYLYASSDKFRYNHERRVVSTQVGGRKNQQVFWKVDPSHGNSYIENVEFNECLHPPVNAMHSSEGRNIFTLIRRGGTRCNFWKFEPVGENVRIQDAQSGGYLYVPIHNSKHNNNGSNVGTERTKDEKSLWRFENCRFTRNKRDIKQLESKVSLDSKTIKAKKRASGDQTSVLSEKMQRNVYLSRKPLAIDSSSQPKIAASSGIRPSSWINDLFGSVKNFIGELFYSKAALPVGTSNTTNSISQVDAKMDVNGTIMLLDLLARKFTGQKYISTVDKSISPLEAQGYALNITNGFKKVVEQAALKSGISMHRLDIDYMGMQKEITRKVIRGQFNEISGVLSSYLEKACPSREAGCPGKLSSKKFDKFMVEFNSGLNVVLNQSIQQILHNGDGRLEVDGVKEQKTNSGPQSYLSNAYVQGHSKDKVSTCLSEIGVTKLGVNLNR